MTANPPCPVCRTAADPATGRCRCPGDPAQAKGGSPDLLAKAEALFESYLAARVVHARRRARDAKVALLRDPRSRDKIEALREAEREAAVLEMQLIEQTRKTQYARSAADDAVRASVTDAAPRPVSAAAASPSDSLAAAKERECPRCAARVPGAVADCRCGFSFARAQGGAEPILLSEAELLALRRGGAK